MSDLEDPDKFKAYFYKVLAPVLEPIVVKRLEEVEGRVVGAAEVKARGAIVIRRRRNPDLVLADVRWRGQTVARATLTVESGELHTEEVGTDK